MFLHLKLMFESEWFQVGDQIIAVNNEDLSQATHRKAIDMISEDKILVMSVRHTGCIPEVSPSSKLLHPSHVAAPASAGPPTHFTHFPLPPDNHRDPHVKYANSSYPNDFAMTKSPQRWANRPWVVHFAGLALKTFFFSENNMFFYVFYVYFLTKIWMKMIKNEILRVIFIKQTNDKSRKW